jgi:DNA-binding response OmpR family regulator
MTPSGTETTSPAAQTQDAPAGDAARPRVLVAEDHEDTRLMLRILLERRGFDVLEAADGEEAVRLVEQSFPDLLLIDSTLPRLDGIAVTRRVRARDAAAKLPIVFLSGHAEPRARTAAFDAGCDDYLVKPDGIGGLAAVLAKHLGRHAAGRLTREGIGE